MIRQVIGGMIAAGLVVGALIVVGVIPLSDIPSIGSQTHDTILSDQDNDKIPTQENARTTNGAAQKIFVTRPYPVNWRQELNRSRLEVRIFEQIEKTRTEHILSSPELEVGTNLAEAATKHSVKMAKANTVSHQLPGELSLRARLNTVGAGYPHIAEIVDAIWVYHSVNHTDRTNPYSGNETAIARRLVDQWMQSPQQREILLNEEYTAAGVGVAFHKANTGIKIYVTVDFGGTG